MKGAEIDKLLQKTALGDNEAFELLYARTKRGVFSFLHSYFHNYADTEDAMQTVYLKIKVGIDSYRLGTNGRAWILQIAKNHALNELKKRRQTVDLESLETPPFAEQPCLGESGVEEVMQRVLSIEERRIIILHVLWGYKHREIAQMQNCATGTITSKYKRAIEKLKRALKEGER